MTTNRRQVLALACATAASLALPARAKPSGDTIRLGQSTALSGINEYFFYAAFVVLQFMVLATAWNILGGYAGYVNFGTAAFFAIGAYTAVVLFKWLGAPLAAGSSASPARARTARACRKPCRKACPSSPR